jgi:hypothetical protein
LDVAKCRINGSWCKNRLIIAKDTNGESTRHLSGQRMGDRVLLAHDSPDGKAAFVDEEPTTSLILKKILWVIPEGSQPEVVLPIPLLPSGVTVSRRIRDENDTLRLTEEAEEQSLPDEARVQRQCQLGRRA